MFSFQDWLFSVTVEFAVSFFILFDKWDHVEGPLTNKNDFSIFDASVVPLSLYNCALTHLHRLKLVVSANIDVSLSLCFESNNRVVIEPSREFNMIGVSSVWQI